MLGRFAASVRDIQRKVHPEPRQFGALSSLGLILDTIGTKEPEVRVWERALVLHPRILEAKRELTGPPT